MLVSDVHPVAILRAVFWVVWSLFLLVVQMIGDQTGLAYSRMGLTMALYVAINVSFCFPHEVDVRVFTILLALSAFCLVILACFPKSGFGSKVRPRILGLLELWYYFIIISLASCLVLSTLAWVRTCQTISHEMKNCKSVLGLQLGYTRLPVWTLIEA